MQIIRIYLVCGRRGIRSLLLPFLCAALACGGARAQHEGGRLHIDARVSQHGSQSGITNTLFSTWLPSGTAFGGLEGEFSLSGTGSGFNEALLLLGTTQDTQPGCGQRDQTTANGVPALSRLWAAILKSNGTGTVTLPVGFSLPHAVAEPAGGVCLATVISAGYPYLARATARYATTNAQLDVTAVPSRTPAAVVLPVGVGGEFLIPIGGSAPLATLVGIRAARTLALDAISIWRSTRYRYRSAPHRWLAHPPAAPGCRRRRAHGRSAPILSMCQDRFVPPAIFRRSEATGFWRCCASRRRRHGPRPRAPSR